ncbi:vacuolar lysine transporter YPQ1 [Primulina eburnea]|uniref:vacuolar lysine transporter YPQ1 n=1 Tax=Primulina eburnea TaxID=1245227 RepID=UPI003C6C85DA
MGLLKSELIICPIDQKCSQWARKYMGYCICSPRDEFSLAVGLISVMSWCVAEVPQIITNHSKKSANGISTAFLLTWIIGDLFNLFGCILEPATLPTQYYMAVLYMGTTLTLATQAAYYGLIYPRLKSNKRRHEDSQVTYEEQKSEYNYGVNAEEVNNVEKCRFAPSSPIPFPNSSQSSLHEDNRFLMSARSLSVSHTPAAGSFPAQRTPPSDAEQQGLKEPLLNEVKPMSSSPSPKPKILLCVVFLVTFFLGSFNLKLSGIHQNDMKLKSPTGGMVFHVRRQLLKAKEIRILTQGTVAAESHGIGSYLGWGMAVVYLGGRLPQICLNIRRGSAEGLNPLMFVFAVVGNATYVASILVKSLDWSKVRPNLPWLVDAGGCMLLDTFILIQFIYFRYRSTREEEKCRD